MSGKFVDALAEDYQKAFPEQKPETVYKYAHRKAIDMAIDVLREFLHETNRYEELEASLAILGSIRIIAGLSDDYLSKPELFRNLENMHKKQN